MLSLNQVQKVCKQSGFNPTCKYLDSFWDAKLGYVCVCTKLTPKAYDALKKKHGGYYHTNATGDNCKGYPLMLVTPQGYDVDKK